ncbi:DUF3000 domain-containing protein [Kineococcus rubinsiae]|uniref:DUF3000 domain-containing protein n=1 Tax=Kineococcus rubinsiae TaxID=2609562 RepID=UPI0027E4B1F5|nr:DUF3000 domain-containing protein [Kineococcus rubinsiae]
MSVHRVSSGGPTAFVEAVAALRDVRLRAEVQLTEVPAPARIAPHAVALAGDVLLGEDELATGRFILLHDPSAPAEWDGTFRVVTYARADLEADLGSDPLLGQVSWTWLEDGLASAGARAARVGGTVTRVLSESYGDLADREPSVDVELRASWTAEPDAAGHVDVTTHLHAWGELLCTVAGLPPLPEGVASLGRRHR